MQSPLFRRIKADTQAKILQPRSSACKIVAAFSLQNYIVACREHCRALTSVLDSTDNRYKL